MFAPSCIRLLSCQPRPPTVQRLRRGCGVTTHVLMRTHQWLLFDDFCCVPCTARAGLLAVALASSAAFTEAAKDPNTLVFASFGDWGWSTSGAVNTLLTAPITTSATDVCRYYTLANYTASPSTFAGCLDGDKKQQAVLIMNNLQQVSQVGFKTAH